MGGSVEERVWERAWEVYGDSLALVLDDALAGYSRSPGFDELTRVHYNTVGREGLQLLTQALGRRWPSNSGGQSDLYVEIRARLRSHLHEYLLRRIVLERQETPDLRDALFAGDVGV